MKKIIPVIFLLFSISYVHAQITDVEKNLRTKPAADTTKGWKTGGLINLNLSQTSFSHWSAGGDNSIAGNGLLSLFGNLKSGKSTWDNNLDIGYGLVQRTDQFKNRQIVKTDDKIDYNSKYGRMLIKNLYYAVFLSFKTQMSPGYAKPGDTIPISNFLSPGYIILAVGLDYQPNKHLAMFLAPVTGRITIVKDTMLSNKGSYGVSPGKHSRQEFGGYLRLTYKLDVMENVALQAKADFFSNYLKNPQNIVVNSECLISMKVNKYIGATLGMTLIYDDAVKIKEPTETDPNRIVGPKIQFKELLGIGFSYKFKS